MRTTGHNWIKGQCLQALEPNWVSARFVSDGLTHTVILFSRSNGLSDSSGDAIVRIAKYAHSNHSPLSLSSQYSRVFRAPERYSIRQKIIGSASELRAGIVPIDIRLWFYEPSSDASD
jgi:hypothetical protein